MEMNTTPSSVEVSILKPLAKTALIQRLSLILEKLELLTLILSYQSLGETSKDLSLMTFLSSPMILMADLMGS